MILYGFGLSNWMESCLKKKMSRGKRENMGRKENQAKMRKSGQLSVVSRKLLLLLLLLSRFSHVRLCATP